jgi:hypothetical protein
MPWAALVAGCAAGAAVSMLLVVSARFQRPDLVLTIVRMSFLPVLAGLAFLPHDRHRQLSGALPTPAWLIAVLRTCLMLPLVIGTCYLQLSLGDRALARSLAGTGQHGALPALSLGLELGGACAVALAMAAMAERSRWHDVAGVIAAVCTLAVLAVLAASPLRLLPAAFIDLAAAQRHDWLRAGLLWALIGAAAAAVAAWSSRDPWRRVRRAASIWSAPGLNR